jgi:hypothetical protein
MTRGPHHLRVRVILIGDEIFTKVGRYVLGNFLTSVIASIGGRLAKGCLR